ncbi:MAG: VCBS repeat-containing protein [Elusimicrobia bacterium]|nr:VCBS repeat-containing protein [Elusimicrobiota bacterium]
MRRSVRLAGVLLLLASACPCRGQGPEALGAAGRRVFDGARAAPPLEDLGSEGVAAQSELRILAAEAIPLDTAGGKPAFLSFADVDGDGSPELLASQFAGSGPLGSGRLDLYRMRRPKDPSSFARETVMADVRFPNDASVDDVNGDGKPDVIVPSGFLACMPGSCGGIAWVERTVSGWAAHRPVTGDRFFYHKVLRADFDGDGVKDWLTVGERKGFNDAGESRVLLFKGKPDGTFEQPGRVIAEGLGSLPIAFDINGDGRLDIASAEYFGAKASFVWLENLGGGRWERHVIDDGSGGAIQLSAVPDLFGDGRAILVGANHTNQCDDPAAPESGVFVFEPAGDPRRLWTKRMISKGIRSRCSHGPGVQGAPGVFAWGDADGDGDVDIVVHGDGDSNAYLLEQTAPGSFETRVLARNVGQGGVAMADLDGDGKAEIAVSSYEKDKFFIVRWRKR